MNEKTTNRYQLKKKLLEMPGNNITERVADTFIKNVTCAFAEEDYFKDPNKGQYHYTADFVQLILTLAKLDNSNDFLHTYLLQSKKCSISFVDMEHFLFLLWFHKDNFSPSFVTRIQDIRNILHLIIYDYKKLLFITDEKIIKKKLLFYLVANENHSSIKITPNLTLSELQEKLICNTNKREKNLSYDILCEI